MAKKSDWTDLTKKLDLNSIVSNIKSMINPGAPIPEADADDPIGVKMAQISAMIHDLAAKQAEQTKQIAKVNQHLNSLYQDIETMRNPPEVGAESSQSKPAAKKETPAQQPPSQKPGASAQQPKKSAEQQKSNKTTAQPEKAAQQPPKDKE